MSRRISFIVTGRVQGVCFRASTVDSAKGLGLTGFVKNARDGSVTGEAQGPEGKVQEFVEFLQTGPPAARVENVRHEAIDARPDENEFSHARH
ncbi:Acylphosphatase [Eremomyces bilateralis CBS 781.70]|uniref:Acylphosphatase n=1 Tax=Eremomyces bilateralis CBS 781.70 TaxID=1392243 RepID=A0A6G1FU39_9PEZI|nr:Acylphosphatase [Eremomyces bilateralis CBS 781.70]KAF1809405.1 Acylphosphatase [Eremomyces bilateralis CBS 781.70]